MWITYANLCKGTVFTTFLFTIKKLNKNNYSFFTKLQKFAKIMFYFLSTFLQYFFCIFNKINIILK